MLAGLTAITAMISADVSAQGCPEWLRWVCPESASSNVPASKDVRQGKQVARPKAQGLEAARRSANPARTTTGGDASSDRNVAREGERGQGTPREREIDDREREALFQQFLEWERQTRLNAGTNR
jgi:hypothetical protein